MNASTRIGVCCYEGDANQVREALPLYLHHGCPVTVASPEDSPVVIDHANVSNRFAGTRTGSVVEIQVPGEPGPRVVTTGRQANMRVASQWGRILECREDWFFLNDSDSFSLAANFPPVLYTEPNTIWCGVAAVPDEHYWNAPPGLPHFALQPPFFVGRAALTRMVAAAPAIQDPFPWIDHFILHMAWKAGVAFKALPDYYGADLDRVPGALAEAVAAVRRGATFIHSSKFAATRDPLIRAREEYLRGRPR